ncbi:MAG: hypothetical protein ACRCS0_05360 [Albidovulum sp.]
MLKFLSVIIAIFGLLHLAALPAYTIGKSAPDLLMVKVGRYFMLQYEKAFSTWFSVLLIASNIFLLALNAMAARQWQKGSALPWLMLAAVCAFLSMDEMLELHERFGSAIAVRLGFGGVMSYPWVVVGLLFAASVGLSFLGFLRRLPRRATRLIVLAGILYVAGAVGMEVIEGITLTFKGRDTLYYLEVLVEECLEMFAMSLFGYALLDHLAQQRASILLSDH